MGIAQVWLSECSVLSIVDASGAYSSAAGSDPVIGAAVETPSPSTPKKMPNGRNYGYAKLVDLDPAAAGPVRGLRPAHLRHPGQRRRLLRAGHGARAAVPPDPGAEPPEQLGSRGHLDGPDHQRGMDRETSSSPFLTQFQAACSQGIAVKLTVDLHQNSPATQTTQGNLFCYGRVLGSLGPIGTGELPEVVPGRQISPPVQAAPAAPAMAAAPQAAPPPPSGMK